MRKGLLFFMFLSVAVMSCQEAPKEAENNFFVAEEKTPAIDSMELVKKNLAADPENIDLLLTLGQLCKENLDYECALDAGAKSFRLDSTNLEARALYAWTLINKPEPPLIDIERAKRHYKYILSLKPNDPETMVNLANTYSFLGNFEASFKFINDALRIDEQYRDAYVLKGSNYRIIGDLDLALSSYQTAVQIDPDFFMGHIQIGYLLTAMERHELALEYYENASEIDPESLEAWYGIAKSHQDLGNYDLAQTVYRKILSLEPSFYISYFNQGFIKHYYVNELDSAEYYYNLSLDVQPEAVRSWHHLGMLYFQQGRKADAARSFSEALTLNPDFEPTLEAKELLR